MVFATFVTFAAFVVLAAFVTFFAAFVVLATFMASVAAFVVFTGFVLATFRSAFLCAVFAVGCGACGILTVVFRCYHILLFGRFNVCGIVVFRSCVVVA